MAAKSAKHKKKKKSPPPQTGAPKQADIRTRKNAIDRLFAAHRRVDVWLSGLLPVLGLLVVYVCMGIAPFGEKSVASVDMLYQYVPFYASLKQAIFGGQGLAYSPSLGMGGSYWALIGYYLTSPFAALSLLIPNEWLLDYMALQELVKVGLAGCSFAWFYRRKFRRHDVCVPLLSVCHALSAFMLTHLSTIIWSDCLVLLPLIVLGLDELIEGKRPRLYVICLALAGIFNYYIAYIIGIYLILYYIAMLWVQRERFAQGARFDRRSLLKNVLTFAGASLLSVGIAAFVLVPSAIAVSASGSASDEAAQGFFAFNPLKLLSQLFYHANYDILSKDSLPLVYCSVFTLLLLPLFFACKGIPARVKVAFGGLAGILSVSLWVSPLNFLWHGLHIPNKLPYRFAFVLVFTLLVMAGYVLEHLDSFSSNTFTYVLTGVLAVAAVIYFADGKNFAMLAGTLVFAILYTVLFVLRSEKKLPSSLAAVLALAVVFTELTASGVLSWRNIEKESIYTPRGDYLTSSRALDYVVSQIAVSDSDVYRVGTPMEGTYNNGAALGYSSLSCFSSTNSGDLLHLLHQMGYNSDGRVSYYYKNFTPMMDSVMNVKYVVYDESVGNPPYLELLMGAGNAVVYRNTLALPRAFAVSEGLTDWQTAQDNPFAVQNDFVRKAVSDSDAVIYADEALTPDASQSYGAAFDEGRVTFTEGGGRLVLNHTADVRQHLYAYINCEGAAQIDVTVGEQSFHISDKDAYLLDFGYCNNGEKFAVSVRSEQALEGYIALASLREDALTDGIARLGENPAEFTRYDSTRMTCEVEVGEKSGKNLLFTSIPYEKGWRVTVNGASVAPIPIGGGLLGVPLTEGHNVVAFRYTVRGLTAGILLSLLCVAAAVWWLYGRKVRS